ncbi:MAG: hypothetical protein JWO50_496 [Candidatus Kaiserbacteria bacterium]|nr:hypothetical protein [Candidatus Kaiserbacteria bacterium]
MDYASFDIKTFIESLDLSVGLFRLVRVDPTEEPTIVVAIAEPDLPPEQKAQILGLDTDMSMAMWVTWMPDQGILRISTNLDLGTDSIGEERLYILTGAVNQINCWIWDRIGKAFVHKNGDDDMNIGTTAFTIFVPPPCLETEEGLKVLRLIIAANMSRLYQEAAVTSMDLHRAMAQEGIMPEDDDETPAAKH